MTRDPSAGKDKKGPLSFYHAGLTAMLDRLDVGLRDWQRYSGADWG